MPFNPQLKFGQIVSNEEIHDIFQCSTQGGMRRSKKTNTLVLISDPKRPLYQDEWLGNVLHYTGMGRRGDQDINFHQNRTLSESDTNGVELFLFEKLSRNSYLYQGRVRLAGSPYKAKQYGEDGKLRTVWIFPLELLEAKEPAPLPAEVWEEAKEAAERHARLLPEEELKRRGLAAEISYGERIIISKERVRNPYVAEYAKVRAKGKCQLCESEAPFYDKYGHPYLEVHHIEWLSRGGPDTLDNTVALCPNCHRKMHVIDDEKDKTNLRKKATRPSPTL